MSSVQSFYGTDIIQFCLSKQRVQTNIYNVGLKLMIFFYYQLIIYTIKKTKNKTLITS